MKLQSKFRSIEDGLRTAWEINDENGYATLTFNGRSLVNGWLVKTTTRGWTIELFSIYTGKAETLFIGREHFEEVEE